ncbi:helix-turn-helix domain-containing protein [Curtobacterium pusillum]|uniref:AraC family transcriptional regulator n=1 Tax=Curtobacterium pusillum TaxID=69373 RepID=UPI0021B67C8C|nr:helix-turn-helix domain-containing protein [Curtobacterium pusillum]
MVQRSQWSALTSDPDTAAEIVTRLPDIRRARVEGDRAALTFEERRRGSDLLSLVSMACTDTVDGDVEASSAMVIFWLKSGVGQVDDEPVRTGRPVLFRHDPQHVRWDGFQLDLMRIDRTVVEQVAAERGAWHPGPLEFQPRHIPEGPALAAWWLMVRSVAAEVLRGPEEVTAERERELTRFAAGGLLTAIPHWPVGQHEPRTAAAARFARAEGFLLDHATEQITVEDVATAAGLSVRGLQDAFRRHHGITPTTYLRRIRLLLAREALESGDDRSVGDVARDAGFVHLGRFAGSYRDEFGELPRETWQAARRL